MSLSTLSKTSFKQQKQKILGIPEFNEIYLACKPVSAQWRDFGTRLGVMKPTLDIIQANNRDVENCMFEMIDKWLKRSIDEVQDGVVPSWKSLCSALLHIERELAINLAEAHGLDENVLITDSSSGIVSPSSVFLPQMCGCGKCTISGWRTSVSCENIRYSKFPKLLLVNSNHPFASKFDQGYDKHASLCIATKKIVDHFRIVEEDTWDLLYEAVDTHKLAIVSITRKLRIWLGISLPMFEKLDSLQNHLHSLRVSWYSFRPLYSLASHFLKRLYPTILSDWDLYRTRFKEYCEERNLSEYADVFFKVEKHNVFFLEVDEYFDNFTLADIEALTDSLSLALGVSSVCLHLVTVKKGSFFLFFYYCYSDYLTIFEELKSEQLQQISEIKIIRIVSLTDLNNQFSYENVQKYNNQEEVIKEINHETSLLIEKGTSLSISSGSDIELEKSKPDEVEELERMLELWKKQVLAKDSELSEKDKEIQKTKEQLDTLMNLSLIKDEEISEKRRDMAALEKLQEREMSQKKSTFAKLYEGVRKSKEVLEMWKKVSQMKDEEERIGVMKEAILKEMDYKNATEIPLRFGFYCCAVCPDGRLLATERDTHTVLVLSQERKLIASFGGKGTNEGQFEFPSGIAVSSDGGYILVTDRHRLQKLTFDGTPKLSVGGGDHFGGSGQLQFYNPGGIAVHPTIGQIFIADQYNNRVQVLNADLTFSRIIALHDEKQFNGPRDVSLDNEGYLYVAEFDNHCITKLTQTGQYVKRFGSAQLSQPTSVTVHNNLVYVCEYGRHCISVFSTQGRHFHSFGKGALVMPSGIAVDSVGNIFICNYGNKNMVVF